MTWAVHNLAAPAVETDAAGTYTLNGKDRIKLGAPLHTAETREEAEEWRAARIGKALEG